LDGHERAPAPRPRHTPGRPASRRQPHHVLDVVGGPRVVRLPQRGPTEPILHQSKRELEAEIRDAGGEEAADVVPHQVADEPVREHTLESRSDLDPKPLATQIVCEQHAPAIEPAADPEGPRPLHGEILQRARHAVREDDPDIDTGFLLDIGQVILEPGEPPPIQQAGAIVDATMKAEAERRGEQPAASRQQDQKDTADGPAALDSGGHCPFRQEDSVPPGAVRATMGWTLWCGYAAAPRSSVRIRSPWCSTRSTSSPMRPGSNVSCAPAARYISGRLRTAPSASASR